ncbi:MAG TPA: hypothetical protein VFC24_19560 [Casimicrobiaceae bacterium]|nr:hypothetical protein [Casimicrobiaceae bacterium]
MRIKHATTTTEHEGDALERDAFNHAFRELGLRWHWDAATFQELKAITDDGERIRTYMETHAPHLLKAYDAQFLANAVGAVKAERAGAYRERRYAAECADFATAQMGF